MDKQGTTGQRNFRKTARFSAERLKLGRINQTIPLNNTPTFSRMSEYYTFWRCGIIGKIVK